MPVRGFLLTFHSQNISGNEYRSNDHIAFDETLSLIQSLGIPLLKLRDVAQRIRAGSFSSLPARFVCLSLDDGPDYDWQELCHAEHGVQESIGQILRRHSRRLIGNLWLRKFSATSFVIASPVARSEIAGVGNPDRMADDWWLLAQRSGFIDIGSHGWNHVHPSVSEMSACPNLIESFYRIDAKHADIQIKAASCYIEERLRGRPVRLFAYPYGQVSDYLADEYFPNQDRLWAAFTTAGAPLEAGADRWRLPRYVCGWHWKSSDDLRRILTVAH